MTRRAASDFTITNEPTQEPTMTMAGRQGRMLIVVALCLASAFALEPPPLQCSLSEQDLTAPDPALQELTYDVGDGEQTTLVYVEPPVESMYRPGEDPPSRTKVTPKFNGLAGKFINMSNKKLTLYWYVNGHRKGSNEKPHF